MPSDSFLTQLQLILCAAVCQTGYSCLLFFSFVCVEAFKCESCIFPSGCHCNRVSVVHLAVGAFKFCSSKNTIESFVAESPNKDRKSVV